MGSAGSGRFGTYHIAGAGRSDIGGTGEVECPKVIENIRLEDVAMSEYYTKHHVLPIVHTEVQLRNKVHLGRLVVEVSNTYEIIGNISTQYNYLLNCIKNGSSYMGRVVSSGTLPIPFVVVTLSV